jgi:PQQ-like domain
LIVFGLVLLDPGPGRRGFADIERTRLPNQNLKQRVKEGGKMRQILIAFTMLLLSTLCPAWSDSDADGDWPMYGKNLVHTFSNPHSQITSRNVSTLVSAWTFVTGDAVTASPAVVDRVVYVGAWDGFFYALDAQTGSLKWKFQLDCQPSVVPLPQVCGGPGPGTATPERYQTPGGIVTASAAVVGGNVYFGGRTMGTSSGSM